MDKASKDEANLEIIEDASAPSIRSEKGWAQIALDCSVMIYSAKEWLDQQGTGQNMRGLTRYGERCATSWINKARRKTCLDRQGAAEYAWIGKIQQNSMRMAGSTRYGEKRCKSLDRRVTARQDASSWIDRLIKVGKRGIATLTVITIRHGHHVEWNWRNSKSKIHKSKVENRCVVGLPIMKRHDLGFTSKCHSGFRCAWSCRRRLSRSVARICTAIEIISARFWTLYSNKRCCHLP